MIRRVVKTGYGARNTTVTVAIHTPRFGAGGSVP
jgi:hypothetical protein